MVVVETCPCGYRAYRYCTFLIPHSLAYRQTNTAVDDTQVPWPNNRLMHTGIRRCRVLYR